VWVSSRAGAVPCPIRVRRCARSPSLRRTAYVVWRMRRSLLMIGSVRPRIRAPTEVRNSRLRDHEKEEDALYDDMETRII
jgi:hypothetical protein